MSTHTYPAPQHPYPVAAPQPPTNGMAIASLVLGILGFAIIPVILGHAALGQIRRRGDRGTGLAITGLVLGYLALAAYAVVAILIIGGLVIAATA